MAAFQRGNIKILTKRQIRKKATLLRKKEEKKAKRLAKRELKLKKIQLVKDMFERDKGVCVFCKKKVSEKHYQTCHIIPEEFEELRYDINNVLLGCFYHHKVGKYSMHNNPLWLTEWLRVNRPEQYKYLMEWLNKKC